MISYSNMNMRELESYVYQLLKKVDNGVNISWGLFLKTANRVFKHVASKTLPYKGWAYQKYTPYLASGDALPYDYIDKVRCVLLDHEGIYREARYAHPREYYLMTDADNKNLWEQAITMSPVYTIFGDIDAVTNEQLLHIYFTPSTQFAVLTYYGEPPDLDDKLDLVPIPNEYEYLAILEVVARLLLLVGTTNSVQQIYEMINQESMAIAQRLAELDLSEKKALELNTPESFYTEEQTAWNLNGWKNLYRRG